MTKTINDPEIVVAECTEITDDLSAPLLTSAPSLPTAEAYQPEYPRTEQINRVSENSSRRVTPNTNDPPPGTPSGGVWGYVRFTGNTTNAVALIGCCFIGCFSLCIYAFPLDKKDAYKVNGVLYDAGGEIIPDTECPRFTPQRN